MIDFPTAFAHSGQDPVNRALIHENQQLMLRGGLPEDIIPAHVSGGIPIQKYLRGLLDQVPQVIHDDQFSMVSRENAAANAADMSSRDSDGTSIAAQYRDVFVDDLMQWFEHHVRVKVRIHGVERSVYVWQSVNDPPVDEIPSGSTEVSTWDDASTNPLDQNVPLESLSSESADSNPLVDHVNAAIMFQR